MSVFRGGRISLLAGEHDWRQKNQRLAARALVGLAAPPPASFSSVGQPDPAFGEILARSQKAKTGLAPRSKPTPHSPVLSTTQGSRENVMVLTREAFQAISVFAPLCS